MYIYREKLYPKQDEDDKLSIELVSMFLNNIRLQKDSIKLFVVLDGHYDLTLNGKKLKLTKKDIFISANHKFEMLSTIEKKNLMMIIELSNEFIVEYGLKLDSKVLKYGNYDMATLRKVYNILFLEHNDALDSDYVKNKLYIELATVLSKFIVDGSHMSSHDEDESVNVWTYNMVMNIAREIIDCPEKNHKLANKAKEFSTSISRISKCFSDVLGINYRAYVNIVRLSKSLELLLETDKDILSILFEIGYNNSKSFHECFKKYLKTTPYVYRKKIRKNFDACYGYTSIYSVFSGEILKEIDSYNFTLSKSFNEKNIIELSTSNMKQRVVSKAYIYENFTVPVDMDQEFTDVYFNKVTSKLNVKNIRVELLIKEGGKLYIKKNHSWEIIRLTDMASYVSAIIKTDIIPIINLSTDYYY